MPAVSSPLLPEPLLARTGRRYGNLIGGEPHEAASGQTFEVRNPADTRQLAGIFPASGPSDVDRAIAAASAAFPRWRDTSAPERGRILFAARRRLEERRAEWAAIVSWEMGKALAEAEGEIQRALNILEFTAGEGRRMVGEVYPAERASHLVFSRRRPLGVVAAITPWNFPANIPTWKVAPALVHGNTVVLKPSDLAPLSAQFLAEALHEAGLPAGVLNVVHGGAAVGEALTIDPRVRGITFTGSTSVGRKINQAAAPHFTRCMLEMGGKNPALVAADADLALAVKEISMGAYSTNGQRCNGTSLVLVEEAIAAEFQDRLLDGLAAMRVGDPLDRSTEIGPMVSVAGREKARRYVEGAVAAGAKVLAGGTALDGDALACGHYFAPTLLSEVTPDQPVVREEIFGPVLTLLPVRDLDHALELANGLPYGLSSSLYTRDLGKALSYARRIETGLVHVNLPTIMSELELPFGGLKDSGFGGREVGAAAEFFTEWQAIYLNPEA